MANREIYFSNAGVPATGLTLTWESLKKVNDGTDFTPQPTFTEIGGGWYKFDINPTERLVGVIDGSASLVIENERYMPVYFDKYDYLYDCVVTPVYDEDTDSLIFMAFMLRNGQRWTSTLTNCEIKVYDKSGTLKFTISSTSETNGVFVITKSSPELIKNEIYYAIATITSEGIAYESTDTYIAIE